LAEISSEPHILKVTHQAKLKGGNVEIDGLQKLATSSGVPPEKVFI
jgi:hypothetical protein